MVGNDEGREFARRKQHRGRFGDVEENASAAAEAGASTAIYDSLASVSAGAQTQAAAAGDVSSSILSLAAQVQEMDATAQHVLGQSGRLTAIVGRFRISRRRTEHRAPISVATRCPRSVKRSGKAGHGCVSPDV